MTTEQPDRCCRTCDYWDDKSDEKGERGDCNHIRGPLDPTAPTFVCDHYEENPR